MTNNIVRFPPSTTGANQTSKLCGMAREVMDEEEFRSRPYTPRGKNMHTFLFRSREAILEADEAELIRDVCFDIEKAQRKLEKLRARIESLQEYSVNELQLLTTIETKLGAAIVAALLSGKR
jgi:DNA repair exonuclease SbcCD ATPase subunit